MSSIVIAGNTSGAITLSAPDVSGTNTITLPAVTGTMLTNKTAGTILQVVTTAKTSAFFLAGGETWTDVTGLSASITPSSTSSRILIVVTSAGSFSEQDSFGFLRIVRDSTAIGIADSRSNATRAGMDLSQQTAGTTTTWALPAAQNFIDSPATASSVTYKIQAWCRNSRNLCVGGSYDASDSYRASVPSTITLMEIAG
jgi:hypothetical protein